MAWETPQFDPSNTFGNFALRSAQAAAPIGAAFARGMELGARRRENAEVQKIRQELEQYRIDKAKMEIEDALDERKQKNIIRGGVSELSKVYTWALENGKFSTEEGRNEIGKKITGISDRIPMVSETDLFKGMFTTLQQYRSLANQADAGLAPFTQMQKADELRAQADKAREGGDVELFQNLTKKADVLDSRARGSRQNIRVSQPGGATVEVTSGYETPSVSGVSQPVRTKAQEKIVDSAVVISGVNDILSKLRPEDVGITGWMGENVFPWVAKVKPEFQDVTTIENRTALATLSEAIKEAVKTDRGQLSNQDVARLEVIANQRDPKWDFDTVRARLTEVKEILSRSAREYAVMTGQPVPDHVKTRQELLTEFQQRMNLLQKQVQENRITREQAQAQAESAKNRLSQALQEFHQTSPNFFIPNQIQNTPVQPMP